MDWQAKLAWAEAEHGVRLERSAAEGEREDFRLAAIAGASWAAGLSALMLGRVDDAQALLRRAAAEYVVSWEASPPGSWGRPIAALRCLLLAGADARSVAERALAAGAAEAEGPIARYCAALALLALEQDAEAAPAAEELRRREDFSPAAVADALAAIARRDSAAYAPAAAGVLRSFEEREAFLEDVPVADTVLVLDALAGAHGIAASPLRSILLPARGAEADRAPNER